MNDVEIAKKKIIIDDILINKIVKVQPVERNRHMVALDKNHDGAFMYTNCFRAYCLPVHKDTGRLLPILTREEEALFEEVLGYEPGSLSVHNEKGRKFWSSKRMAVRLKKDGISLNLMDPVDNLKWRILKVNQEIAPSWEERYDSGEYWFALVDQDYQVQEDNKAVMLKEKAYAYFGKIKSSPTKMRNFLRVYGVKTSESASTEFLVSEIGKLLEAPKEKLNELINIFEDKDFDVKVLVQKALECGAIIKERNVYKLPGGDRIGLGLEETVINMKKFEKDQDPIYLTILAKVDKVK